MKAIYHYTRNKSGIKKEYTKGKFVHKGCIVATKATPDGVIICTKITEYKHSGKHQYFIDRNGELEKLDGNKYKHFKF